MQKNAHIERFNGSFRRKLLAAYLFRSLAYVHQFVEEWICRGSEATAAPKKLGRVPERIQADRDKAFSSKALDRWAYDYQVTLDFSRLGKMRWLGINGH